tara:strand:- start:2906 stop:3160 length:255 start_codon:yes stop_codon:yes gene_type:complete
MLALIKSLIRSLELFLNLKNKRFYYDLYREQRKREDEILQEIEKLRDSGNSNDADRADLLRKRFTTEREQFEHISAFYSKTQEK